MTESVSDSELTTLSGTAAIAAIASADLGTIAASTQLSHLILLLEPSADQTRELAALLAAQADPTSPSYRRWLTPAEYGARFGVGAADLDAVTGWLTSHGFAIESIPAGRRAIVFSGTAGQVATAFGTELHRYQVGDEVRVANQRAPRIPRALAPVVRGLVSMNDVPRVPARRDLGTFKLDRATGAVARKTGATTAKAAADAKTEAPQFTTTINGATYHVVAPHDFATIYNLQPLWNQGIDGTGQRIAIVSRSDLDLRDVDRFRANFGLPATKVNKIFVNASPGITADVAETALDVQWSGAVAKNATIDLVIASSSLTSDGVDLSSLYIVNNNVAPVVSVSYGLCELGLGPDGNAFYNTLWQQAAAQGQTVFVSSGDAGSTTCNQGSSYSTLGLSVNGLGSTPYNVAVGGTDLYGTYAAPATYWSDTNDPTTKASALGYVPEVPWNDSCGNPVLLSVLRANKGYTDATTAALCNNSKVSTSNYRNIVGGGGGASNCLSTGDGTSATCLGGYTKPAWQAGPGVPSDDARYVPDVSLFSGDGLWGSFLPYCVGSQTQSGMCDLTQETDIQGAGGTSFASPAFAGIMALINQKTSSIQGNANTVFYKLAANQGALDCTVENNAASPDCVYHDVALGGNATPCYAYGSAKDCTVAATGNIWGVVTGHAATKGYDPAIGLGSVNITNLVNQWSTVTDARVATTTTLTLDAATIAYGSGPKATVVVTSANGTPSGDFAIVVPDQAGRDESDPPGTLRDGTGTLQLGLLPAGSYAITAHYAGDAAFASSDSAPQTITIVKAATTLTIDASRANVTASASALLTLTLSSAGTGAAPTGAVTVTNTTTGEVLGSYALAPSAVAPTSIAYVQVAGTQLIGGANTLSLAYAGDGNHAAVTATQSLAFDAPFAAALSPSEVTLATAATATATNTTLTISATSLGALAYPISLACVGDLPAGATCALSTSVLSDPTTTATVTVGFAPKLAMAAPRAHRGANPTAAFAGLLAIGAMLAGRKRLAGQLGVLLLVVLPATMTISCGDNDEPNAPTLALSATASSAAVALGSDVTLQANATTASGSGAATGSVTWMDSYRGTNRALGTSALDASGATSLTVGALDLGSHAITAVFAGDAQYPAASSSAVAVAVSSKATLQIRAVDAHGYTVTLPLAVTLQ